MNKKKVPEFQSRVWGYYKEHGRNDLPWRSQITPYRILVSEIMLQQTQVSRVIPKFNEWMKYYPNVKTLVQAPRGDVLKAWQGLGYNRRAINLHKVAQEIVEKYSGKFPKERRVLEALPGIGPYTGGAICTFAWNKPEVFIETNIRTVFIHHFFKRAKQVSDKEILPLIKETLDTNNPREWYWALMDYGAHLKQMAGNASRRSTSYQKQSQFKGSNREQRAEIVRILLSATNPLSKQIIQKNLGEIKWDVEKNLADLVKEGLAQKTTSGYYQIP